MSGAVDVLEGKDVIQRDLGRLEKWASVNHCTSARPSRRSCLCDGAIPNLSIDWVMKQWSESSSVVKDLWILVDEKWHMLWQCTLAAQKAYCILGYIKTNSSLRDVILSLFATVMRPHA